MARIATLTPEERAERKRVDQARQNLKRKLERLRVKFPHASEETILDYAMNGAPKKTKAEIAKDYRERNKALIATKKAEAYQKDKVARSQAYNAKMASMNEFEREEYLTAKREYQREYRKNNSEAVKKYSAKSKKKKIEKNVSNMVEFLLNKATEEGLA